MNTVLALLGRKIGPINIENRDEIQIGGIYLTKYHCTMKVILTTPVTKL